MRFGFSLIGRKIIFHGRTQGYILFGFPQKELGKRKGFSQQELGRRKNENGGERR